MADLMLVDDDEDFALAAAKSLKGAGHDVRVELDIDSATRHLQERPPDLLILDVMFPEDASAGFKLARSVRQAAPNLKNLPILMLTAVNQRFPLGFGRQDLDDVWMPVSDFLEKPVDLKVLRKRVDTLVGRAGTPSVT
jgi:DNA-binding response OmpR family regulator